MGVRGELREQWGFVLPCARAHRNYEGLLWRARRGIIRGAWTLRSPGWVRVGIAARRRHTIGVITDNGLRAMHLLPERPIEWKVVGGWTAAQAHRTTHDRVHAFTGGWFTSAWWILNPGGWRRWPQAERSCGMVVVKLDGLSIVHTWYFD